jgi:uncharacterized delta-60 repeat protein
MSGAGSIDPAFGTQGSVAIPVIPSGVFATSPYDTTVSALGPDGAIVLVGSYVLNDMGYFTIEELNADGSPDTSFGQNGRATFEVGTSTTTNAIEPDATSVVVRPDGTINVGGILSSETADSNTVFGVIQVTPTGTLDTSFGKQGMATLPTTTAEKEPFINLSAMTLDSSGGLIVAGEAAYPSGITTTIFAAKFDASGTLDTSFGTDGVSEIPVAITYTNESSVDEVTSVAIQPSGRIILTGEIQGESNDLGTGTSAEYEGLVVGLTASGAVDTTFGGTSATGEVFLPFDASDPTEGGSLQVIASSLQTNGAIVLVEGTSQSDNLTRLNADGTLDTTFGTDGVAPIGNLFSPLGVTAEANGQILVTGSPGGLQPVLQGSADSLFVERFDSDGTVDSIFGDSLATPGIAEFSTPIPADSTTTTHELGTLTSATIGASGQIILTGYFTVPVNETTPAVPYFLAIVAYSETPVEDQPPADYDGSGVSNIAVYLTASGEFAYRPTNGGADVIEQFGIPGVGQTIPAPGDYDGSGQTEIAAYLPSQGVYAYRPADGGPDVLESFGIAGPGQSIPASGDYFGTGVDDIALYIPALGAFAIRNPAGGPDEIIPFGTPGMGQSIPVTGDYFGTDQSDIAVYLTSIGAYAIRNPSTGADEIISFGIPGAGNSIPIPGDYDGSGKTELAVYLPSLGEFIYRPANGGPDVVVPFGTAGDGSIPDVGDYDGSGVDEVAIYDPNYGDFAYRPANGGPDVIVPFGTAGIGASLPLAAPISSNVTSTPGSVSALSTASTSSTISSESVTLTKATATPNGPLAKAASKALVRIASTLPAQADPSKPKG